MLVLVEGSALCAERGLALLAALLVPFLLVLHFGGALCFWSMGGVSTCSLRMMRPSSSGHLDAGPSTLLLS